MATQRPLKEGSVRTYQEKVGLGFVDILANEMDADLDTIYAAWNAGGGVPGGAAGGDLGGFYPNPTVVQATGNFTVVGGSLAIGQRVALGVASDLLDIHWNSAGTIGYDINKSGWMLRSTSATADAFQIFRRPIGSATQALKFFVDAVGTVGTSGSVQVGGTGAGVRFQNVGAVGGDGFSNSVALGWDGTLKLRIDGSQIGTIQMVSDARVKRAVQEDVPGLATVLALRPISFEFDQTKRALGFETGRHYGLLAQEVEPHLPLLLREELWDPEKPDERHFALQYVELIPVLLQALKELAARVTLLEAPA